MSANLRLREDVLGGEECARGAVAYVAAHAVGGSAFVELMRRETARFKGQGEVF